MLLSQSKKKYRIEMSPLSNKHGRDHTVIMLVVNLFAIFNSINFNGIDNSTYRKVVSCQA